MDSTPPEKREKRQKVSTQGVQLVSLLKRYVKAAAVVLSVWAMGYFRVSYSWVMMGICVYVGNAEYRKVRKGKLAFARQAIENEQAAVLARIDELPSWVYFPDVERAEWVNKIIKQMWPYIGKYVETVLRTTVEMSIQDSLPKAFTPFKFVTVDLGSVPPRIGGIKVYIENVKRNEIYLDVEIFYTSDSNIVVAVKGMQAGIKDLTIQGTLRVAIKPLISQVPIIGAMNFFFLNTPAIDFNLTKFANMLDAPVLSNTLRSVIEDQVSYYMVLPNQIHIELADGLHLDQIQYTMPKGVIRIHIVGARDLKRADIALLRKGKSDPYCKLYVGANTFETKVIKDSITPSWNQYFEAVVHQMHGQFVEIEVMDKDPGDDDDLGTASIDIEQVAKEGSMDSWLPLENVKTGMIHVRAVWLHLSKNPTDLDKAVGQLVDVTATDHLATALLLLTLDSAKGLRRSKKSMSEPSTFARLTVGNCVKKSRVCVKSSEPKWEENFQFLVYDPRQQDIEIIVMDQKSGKRIGRVSVELKDLLTCDEMTVSRPYPLEEAGADSSITLHLCLRMLSSDQTETYGGTNVAPENEAFDTPDDATSTVNNPISDAAANNNDSSTDNQVDKNGVTEEVVRVEAEHNVDIQIDEGLRRRTPASVRDSASSLGPGLGRIQLTIRYSEHRNRLVVVVHTCSGLLACDSDHLSDPYVRLYLLPDRSSGSKRKTEVVRNNLNPVFDETFDWSISALDATSRSLEVSVKNSVGVFSKARTHIGEVTIQLAQLDLTTASTQWYELDEPDAKESS